MSDEKKNEFDEVTVPDLEIVAADGEKSPEPSVALSGEPATEDEVHAANDVPTSVSQWSTSSENTAGSVQVPEEATQPPAISIPIDIPKTEPKAPPSIPIPTLDISAAIAATPPNLEEAPEVSVVPTEPKTNTNFNIFSEKTQVYIPSVPSAPVPSPSNHASSSVFDERTIVGSLSNYKTPSPNLRFLTPQTPPHVGTEAATPVNVANEVTFKPEPEDTVVNPTAPKFAFKMPNIRLDNLPKVEFSRRNIAIGAGAVAIAMLVLHSMFGGQAAKIAAPIVAQIAATPAESEAAVARPETHIAAAKTREISSQPTDAHGNRVLHQTSNDFLWHFRASVEQNQNLGREATSP